VLMSGFLDRQPTGDVSHTPSSRLPLLSARPAVTFPASERHHLGRYQFILFGEQSHVREPLV